MTALANQIDQLHATIDGAAVPDLFSHREVSPDFSAVIAANNAFGEPAGPSGIARREFPDTPALAPSVVLLPRGWFRAREQGF